MDKQVKKKSIDEQKIQGNKKLRKVAHEMHGQTGQKDVLEIHWRSGSSGDE